MHALRTYLEMQNSYDGFISLSALLIKPTCLISVYGEAWVWCSKRIRTFRYYHFFMGLQLLQCCRRPHTTPELLDFFPPFLLNGLWPYGIPFHSLMGNWTWMHPLQPLDGHLQCDYLREWLTSDSLRFAIVSIFTNILLFSERTIIFVLCITLNEPINIDKVSIYGFTIWNSLFWLIDWFNWMLLCFFCWFDFKSHVSPNKLIVNFEHNVNFGILEITMQGEQVDSTRPVIWKNWSLDQTMAHTLRTIFPSSLGKLYILFFFEMPPLCRVVCRG